MASWPTPWRSGVARSASAWRSAPHAVTQRRREIGVRMALGAQRGDVLGLVLTRALWIVVAGVAFGLVAAVSLTRLLRSFLFNVTPTDPIAFIGVTVLLIAIGVMAAWLPARRAARRAPCGRRSRVCAERPRKPSRRRCR